MTLPQLTLYTRVGCHLCEAAEDVLRRLPPGRAEVTIVDIDQDPALRDRYTVRVPVVELDGVEIAEYEVDPAALAALLR
ncbi:MAG TPA: glutaredoxin family protein [Cryptosporangiaceae bacterium]|nr:glutaredoxin family protein [Cryptosporangiaceae bacterium]